MSTLTTFSIVGEFRDVLAESTASSPYDVIDAVMERLPANATEATLRLIIRDCLVALAPSMPSSVNRSTPSRRRAHGSAGHHDPLWPHGRGLGRRAVVAHLMGAPQRYATRRLQAEAVLEVVLADPDALVAELVRRGHLEQLTNGTYRRPNPERQP